MLVASKATVAWASLCSSSWNSVLRTGALTLHCAAQIMTLPAVVLLEYAILRRRQTPLQLAAVAVVCLGVGLATVADSQARPNAADSNLGGEACQLAAHALPQPFCMAGKALGFFPP